MKLLLRGVPVIEVGIGAALVGHRCDAIELNAADVRRLLDMAEGGVQGSIVQQARLREILDNWLLKFVP